MKSLLLIAALFVSSSAYADTITLTVYTQPRGATVYATGIGGPVGYSPVVLKFEAGKGFFKNRSACMNTLPINVVWASGATAQVPAVNLCASVGKNQAITFQRPDVEGAQTDAFFALELDRIDAMREADRAAARRAAWDRYVASLAPRPTITCTSTTVVNTVYTTCR